MPSVRGWFTSQTERTSRQRVFAWEMLWLLILLALGWLYFKDQLPFEVPKRLGSVPIGVPWFGALGAILISISAVFDYTGKAWDPRWELWHYSRFLIGASVGIVAVLIFQAGIVSIGSDPTPSSSGSRTTDLAYYVIAFIVGYREATFRELIKRVVDVMLKPSGGVGPVITSVVPDKAPAGQTSQVSIIGQGLGTALAVRVGDREADQKEVTETHVIIEAPAQAAGVVPITVETKDGSAAAKFEYT